MAGPWLRFRGHLDNIANNTLTGAVNAFGGATNAVVNQLDGSTGEVPAVARAYKAAGVPTLVVGDSNYGEGSSREHAAMQPRHLGVRAVLVKSFERIHRSNLVGMGVLPLEFKDGQDAESLGLSGTETFDIDATIHGGGTTGHAGALRLGIARGLVEIDAEHRDVLKKAGFLTRDPRKKESKKYGLKKARKAPQYSKR